jgi:acyl-CoA dehydrogenase
MVADVPAQRLAVREGHNLAGEPSDEVQLDLRDLRAGVEVTEAVAVEYHHRRALARCAQISGAMGRVLAVVLEHVEQRHQFGRPIGKFQAVQALVTDLAAEAALAQTSTDAAVDLVMTHGWQDPSVRFAVAVAASTVGHAASVVVRNAHQAAGAIGATLEHELPRLTKPILARRGEVCSIHEWDAVVGEMARGAGSDGLWALITSTSTPSSEAPTGAFER